MLDTLAQGRGRVDPGRGAPRERHRALLLGEPVGELARRGDTGLEHCSAIRRERPVCERRQLGDVRFTSSKSHRHTGTLRSFAVE
jgi:hypothetical protein